jgi:hypothetical protein
MKMVDPTRLADKRRRSKAAIGVYAVVDMKKISKEGDK